MKAPRIPWFGLTRHLPAGWHPPAANWRELLLIGSGIGTCLLALFYLWQIIFYDHWMQTHPFDSERYLYLQIVVAAMPVVIVLGLNWFAGWFKPPQEGSAVEGKWSHGGLLLFQLREAHGMKALNLFLFFGAIWGLSFWLIPLIPGNSWPELPFSIWHRQMPPLVSLAVTALLGLSTKRQRFHPRAFRLLVPVWLTEMLRRIAFRKPSSHS